MSAGLPLPDRVFGHGFLVRDGVKMGKSSGNTIDPVRLVERYKADAVRYYFLKEIEFGRDGVFDEERFVNIVNADLANDLGNLLNRTSKMVHKYFGGELPDVEIPQDNPLRSIAEGLGERVAKFYDALAFSNACEEILTLVRMGNKYLDEQAPWSLYKKGDHEAVGQILYTVLESVRIATYLLSPIVPSVSTAIYQQLGLSVDFSDSNLIDVSITFQNQSRWGILRAKQALPDPSPVFQKLDFPSDESSA
jgi:methionyl-tRNA synthetase